MKNITVAINDDIEKMMESLTDVNWSEVARRAIVSYIQDRQFKESRIKKIEKEIEKIKRKIK